MSYTCPRCNMTSHNPNDEREGYCGNCHDWTRIDPRDEMLNNITATGAVLAALHFALNGTALKRASTVVDDDDNATNVIEVEFEFMKSPYRITVERVAE